MAFSANRDGGCCLDTAGILEVIKFDDLNGNDIMDGDEFPIVSGYAPLITDSSGRLTVKNLAPGKYGTGPDEP